MSCRNWESGVVVQIANRKSSSTVPASFSGSTSASTSTSTNASTSASTKVKAEEAQARSSVQAGKISGEPDKGCDTSQHIHNQNRSQIQSQKQKQKHKQEDGEEAADIDTDTDTDTDIAFEGTVPIPMQRPGRRYRAGEEPWFYSVQG
ncbi:uncharacterized protein FTOL_01749 [Fusarium torulosum]|uniref:Uncharacterized protein n=1 Tax=Fusarium torulosum TaxID=33205 RepID=A0AAE8M0I1_9HYPO|nr:uncharacterized protein FTOL_01749 [Fusarium torulosum]